MEAQKTGEAIELFKEGLEMFFHVAVLPHKDTLVAQQSLTRCLSDTGTTFKKEGK